MKDILKLSLWDAFAFYVSGAAIILNIVSHLLLYDQISMKLISQVPTSFMAVLAVVVPLLAGLLFEPFANVVGGFFFWVMVGGRGRLGLTQFFKPDPTNDPNSVMQAEIRSGIPQQIRENMNAFHWAKDFMAQEKIANSYMTFISKFGFYRNMACLAFVNALFIIPFYGSSTKTIFVFLLFSVAGMTYAWRCRMFASHLSDPIYRHYLVYLVRKKPVPPEKLIITPPEIIS
jgi:hypothetical protein